MSDDYKRQLEFDKAYLGCALAVSKLSRAKKKQVGCIIVDPDTGIVAEGFNGTPPGLDNTCESFCSHEDIDSSGPSLRCRRCSAAWDPIQQKTPDTLITLPEVIHAEANAIMKAARSTKSTDGTVLYSTLEPCFDCSKLIVGAGIHRVVYLEKYRYNGTGLLLLEKASIQVHNVLL